MGQICRSHSVAIARGTREWREISISEYRFCQDEANGIKQLKQLFAARTKMGSVLFDRVTGIFKTENFAGCGGVAGRHGRDNTSTGKENLTGGGQRLADLLRISCVHESGIQLHNPCAH